MDSDMTWEQCAQAGMTMAEAAAVRGCRVQAAYRYATRHRLTFAAPIGRIYENGWPELFDEGLTASEAAKRSGRTVNAAYKWAARSGLSWPRAKPRPRPRKPQSNSQSNRTSNQPKTMTGLDLMRSMAERESQIMRQRFR